jgi:hypothetical protein
MFQFKGDVGRRIHQRRHTRTRLLEYRNVFPNPGLCNRKRLRVGFSHQRRNRLTKLQTLKLTTRKLTALKFTALGAIAIVSAAVASPVFAQDAGMAQNEGMVRPAHHGRGYDQRNFRGAYNYDQPNDRFDTAPLTNEEYRNLENFGMSGRDPSRIGGESPWLNPPP